MLIIKLKLEIYAGCAKMNFLRQGFPKLSSDRQLDRHTHIQTRLTLLPLRGWSVIVVDVIIIR